MQMKKYIMIVMLIYLSISFCGCKQGKTEKTPPQEKDTVAAKEESSNIEENSNNVQLKVSKEEALKYIAETIFKGPASGLIVNYDDKSKRYIILVNDPQKRVKEYWQVDAFNGDVFSNANRFQCNMFDSSQKEPSDYSIELKDGHKTNFSILRTNTPINIDSFEASKQRILIDFDRGDFNGDGVNDIAYVTSDYSSTQFKENINFIIQDGATNKFTKYKDDFKGNSAVITEAKISSKGKCNLMMYIQGGIAQPGFYLFSYDNGNINTKFSSDQSLGLNFTDFKVNFLDGYKINAHSESMQYSKIYSLRFDLKKNIEEYEKTIYSNGKLKEPWECKPESTINIEVKDVDNDGIDELITYQKIRNSKQQDSLGDAVILWKYKEDKYIAEKCTFNAAGETIDNQWYLKGENRNDENAGKVNAFLNRLRGCWFREDFANNVIGSKSGNKGIKNTNGTTVSVLEIQFFDEKESILNMSFGGTYDFHQGSDINYINKVILIDNNTADIITCRGRQDKDITYRITIDTKNDKFNIKSDIGSFDYVGKVDDFHDTSFFTKQIFIGSYLGDRGNIYNFNSDYVLLNGERYLSDIILKDDVLEFKKGDNIIRYCYEFKEGKLLLYKAIENPVGWGKGDLYEVLTPKN